MNKLTRISFAVLSCGALGLYANQARAQGDMVTPQSPAGMSDSMATTTTPSSSNNYSNSMQALPTEPTGAGYAGKQGPGGYSWLPYTTSGYIGVGIGNGTIDADCVPLLTCDDPDGAVNIYTGGMFTPYLGMQLGYFRLGDTDRNGGTTKISGVNISLTGMAPLGPQFTLVGRIGGTYGWTDVTVGFLVPAPSGDENGFAPAFGAGVSWDFNRNMSLTLDWDRHNLKYPGGDNRNTDIATIGLKYRF